MPSSNITKEVYKYAQKLSEKDDIHGFAHILRVYKLCMKLAEDFEVNYKILEISALLHDIGRNNKKLKSRIHNHANLSAKLAKKFLLKQHIELSEKELENIIHSIQAHSFSNKVEPISIEAKILSDADKLDALGAIGLYRTIGFTIKKGGFLKDVINHIRDKILRLKDKLYLEISREIATERESIIKEFYDNIIEEI